MGRPQVHTALALVLMFLVGCLTRELHAVSATAMWTPKTYPNPSVDLQLCGRRGVSSRVCDPDGLISYQSANVVEATLNEIAAADEPFAKAGCSKLAPGQGKGYQVAVALMKKMALEPGESVADAAERFTKALFDRWGVGDKDCKNGVLFLLSREDRQLHIQTGAAGAEDLDSERIQYVIAALRPKLVKGDYDGAVEQAVVDIGLALAGGEIPGEHHEDGANWPFILFGCSFAGIFGFTLWNGYKKRQAQQQCKKLLDKLRREQATVMASSQYPATSCPICLEDFTLAGDESWQEVPSAPPAPPDLMAAAPPGDDVGGRPEAAPLLRQRSSSKTRRLEGAGGSGGAEGTGHAHGRPRNMKPLVLPCGHTFCEECISRWLDKNNTCPVCRVTLAADPAGQSAGPQVLPPLRQQQNHNMGVRRMWQRDMYQSEFMFRLGSLHRMYPYIVTLDMLSFWHDQVNQGCVVDWPSERFFQLQNHALRAERASAGQWGASAGGFGGGGSAGGASGGGGW